MVGIELEQEPCDDCISRQAVLDKWENTTLRGRTEFDQVIMMMPSVMPQALKQEPCKDAISRQAVLDLCDMRYNYKIRYEYDDDRGCHIKGYDDCSIINVTKLKKLPPVTQIPKGNRRKFEEIVVQYQPAELCMYPEYKGKPYFSIKYEENGKHIIGYGTYDPEVLSGYLRDYFITPTIEADEIERERSKYE